MPNIAHVCIRKRKQKSDAEKENVKRFRHCLFEICCLFLRPAAVVHIIFYSSSILSIQKKDKKKPRVVLLLCTVIAVIVDCDYVVIVMCCYFYKSKSCIKTPNSKLQNNKENIMVILHQLLLKFEKNRCLIQLLLHRKKEVIYHTYFLL